MGTGSDEADEAVRKATEAAEGWLPLAASIESQLAPMNQLLFSMAALRAGESVLDVGCGTGATTREAAQAVEPSGSVIGIDAATNAIEYARRAAAADAPIEWIAADAQRYPFRPATVDVVISRLGVMFFDDTTAALRNLATATRPGGRFAALVWTPRDQSPFHQRSIAVAVAAAARCGWTLEPGPVEAGPFGFGNEQMLARMVEAGWARPGLQRHAVPLYHGGDGATPESVAQQFVTRSPVSGQLADAPAEVVDRVRQAVSDDLAECYDGTGVRLAAGLVLLHAGR